jgi:hypothetical protein
MESEQSIKKTKADMRDIRKIISKTLRAKLREQAAVCGADNSTKRNKALLGKVNDFGHLNKGLFVSLSKDLISGVNSPENLI